MQLATRNLLNRTFTWVCTLSIVFMTAALVILLGPMIWKGLQAYFFWGTVEHREVMHDRMGRGSREALQAELAKAEEARQLILEPLQAYRLEWTRRIEARMDEFAAEEAALYAGDDLTQEKIAAFYEDFGQRKAEFEQKERVPFETVMRLATELIGPLPAYKTLPAQDPQMDRYKYGAMRWDEARKVMHELRYATIYVSPDGGKTVAEAAAAEEDGQSKMLVEKVVERKTLFEGTRLEPMFAHLTEENLREMMLPEFTFYWAFLTDDSFDSHMIGGIGREVRGTIFLTIGAMLFAVPMGIIAAIYLAEYAGDGRIVSLLRSCISTLAGVPSIVFGLFGLAFFIMATPISEGRSVLAGSLTLGLLVLPTIIRAAEEAIRAVPQTYKEASMGLGASRWHAVITVILPAALPGVLTGIVISMGRAAGETAPIIFTAAASIAVVPGFAESLTEPGATLSAPTMALPWSIYNISTEHEAVDQIRHVQFGMVMTLVAVVLSLNLIAIVLRARIAKKLRG
jgi:phosphate transport system permease protein